MVGRKHHEVEYLDTAPADLHLVAFKQFWTPSREGSEERMAIFFKSNDDYARDQIYMRASNVS